MMEWYPSHEMDDLVLPKQQESFFDDLPPTTDGCWPPQYWGINSIPTTTSDDSLFHNRSSVYDRPDFQFNQLSGGDDPMEDIFVSSLLKEDHHPPGSRYYNYNNQHHILPFCFSPESQSSFIPEDGDATSMPLGASSDANGPESSGYYESGRWTFPPSAGWVNNNGPTETERKVLPSSDQDSRMGTTIRKETSMEESVLNQLETVMTQLNDKTRLCFRDSLYRLARSTKRLEPTRGQNDAGFSLNNPPPLPSDYQMARSGTAAGVAESGTNAFDRAVANLMFNNADGFNPTTSSKSVDIPAGEPSSYNYSMDTDMHHHSQQPKIIKTESQDPVLSMVNQRQTSQKEAGLLDFYLSNFFHSEPAGSDIRWTAHGG